MQAPTIPPDLEPDYLWWTLLPLVASFEKGGEQMHVHGCCGIVFFEGIMFLICFSGYTDTGFTGGGQKKCLDHPASVNMTRLGG